MLLIDSDIRVLCCGISDVLFIHGRHYDSDGRMIEPFSEPVSGNGVISYGLTSAGYDLRLADEFVVFKNVYDEAINPKWFNDSEYVAKVTEKVIASPFFRLPPHSYVLGRSLEYLRVPRWLKGRCTGKSTYARSQILINTTPLEPGWEGHLCIEIGNVGPSPAIVHVGEGIAQLEFELLTDISEQTYDRKHGVGGKYQGQTGVTLARVL